MKLHTLTALFLGLLAPVALADITVTSSTTAPLDRAFLSIVPGAANDTQWRNSNQFDDPITLRRDIGQSFQINDTITLSSLTLRLAFYGEGAPDSDFTLSIYKFADRESFTPEGSPLYTAPGVMLGDEDLTEGAYLTFTLDTPVELEGGAYYGFMLSFPENARRRQMSFHSTNGSSAPLFGAPIYYQYDAASTSLTWQRGVNALEMYAVAIPEPGTAGLTAGAAAILAAGSILKRRAPKAITQ